MIRIAAIAAGLAAASIFALLLYIDAIASAAIERGSTYALGVDTNLDSARIGLFSGSFRVAGLEIANPPGFEDPRFLGLGEARMDLDMGTLRKPTVIVPLFAIHDVEVDLDKQRGKANYDVILDNLARFESEDPEPEPTPEADTGPGKRFVIREMVIRDVTAHVRVVEAGGMPQVDVVVPEIRIQNLGGEDQPLTAAQVTDVIVKAVLASIAKAGAGLPGGVADALSGGLGRLASVSVELPDGGRLAGSATDAVGAGADAASDALDAGADAASDSLEAGKSGAKDAGKKMKGLGGKLFGDD
jgi:membrane protein YdbS with pleckstrin-like domain